MKRFLTVALCGFLVASVSVKAFARTYFVSLKPVGEIGSITFLVEQPGKDALEKIREMFEKVIDKDKWEIYEIGVAWY